MNEGGTIGTLSNSGTIWGGSADGVINTYNRSDAGLAGTIGVLDNMAGGVINGGATGVYNELGSTIGVLVNDGTISGGEAGIDHFGGIGTLINGGLITGGAKGVDDLNAIGLLSNAGTISGGDTGLIVQGEIGTLTNAGTIAGGSYGLAVIQYGGVTMIDSLQSGGLISGGYTGLLNENGTIAALTNGGRIVGGTYGIENTASAAIGGLVNGGLIHGGSTGIDNAGSIGVLSNAGMISGGVYGVNDSAGTIGMFENAGVITGGTVGVILDGGTLQNSGTIAGATGVILTGDNASIFDSGTIASTDGGDAVLFQAADPDSLTLTTGADVIGTIDGGGTAGDIVLEGMGTLTADIANFTAGSALNVVSGASWAGAGNWTVATLTNDGVFQGGLVGAPLTLTGNFVQTPNGTLLVAVTPAGTSQFAVTGTAVLAGGLSYRFAPGTYRAGTYGFLTASGGISGGFVSVSYGDNAPAAFTHATQQELSTGNLVLTAVPVPPPADDAVFAAVNQVGAASAQAVTQSLLDKAAEGGAAAADSAACAAEAAGVKATGNGPNVSGTTRMAAAVGQAFCAAGGWVEATGGVATMDGGGDGPGYSTNMAGFLAGIDAPVNQSGTRVGIAVGYDEDWLKDGEGGKASLGTTRAGVFGSQALGDATLAADFMYGAMGGGTTRQTGIGVVGAKPHGDVLSGGAQAGTAMRWQGFGVAPAAGVRLAAVQTGSFDEAASGLLAAFAVKGAASQYTSVQPYLNVTVTKSYLTGSGVTVTPEVMAGYAAELGDRGKAVDVTAADGTGFASGKTAPDASAAEFSAGLAARQGSWSLYAKYSAEVSGNWTAQMGQAGVQARF